MGDVVLRGALLVVAARAVLKESLRLPGARMVRRQASWTKDANKEDIPELVLNRLLAAEVFLQMLASGLGTVALVWATVVLLGGFSTMLVRLDFWLTTAIVVVETARIVGYNSAPEAKFFVDVLAAAFSGRNILQIGSATGLVGLITMGPALIALAPIFTASACMTLSIWRLLSIGRHGYGGSSTESSNANLKPALILFYALVLSQGVLFLMWFVVAMSRSAQAKKLRQYFKNEETITNRFIASTLDTCVEKGVVNTLNRTVITFAEELLQSEQSGDHGVAVSVLHVVVIERKERRAGAIEQICSSEQLVGMLFRLLSSKSSLDLDTRTLAAKIVKKLSNKLYLANIPGAANVLSSMLDACFMETRAQTSHTTGQTLVSIKSDNGEIIVHGLQILCKLADDPGNCTEINNTKDLVSKIIASLTHGLHKAIASESATVEVVIASLGLLVKLTSRTGESSTELRRTILDDSRTVGNILWILSNSSHTDVKILAVKILTTLTLGRLSIKRKRLILGQVGSPDLQQLVTMLSDDGNSKENRAVTAQLLAQLCANSRTDHDRNRLRPISSALSTVLKTISNTPCTRYDVDTWRYDVDTWSYDVDTWRFLGCFLGLTMQICVNLGVGADAFATAVKGIPDLVLVNRLKDIVDTCMERLSRNSCMDGENDIALMIMKAAAKLATWMMKMNHHYITHFCQVNILEKLEDATNAMAKLDEYMILTGGCPDGSGRHEKLSSLVKGVKDLVSQQQACAHIRQIV
ncbi:hypothetical protein SEVIR_3G403900v4 [Setaria viridis]|uniref:Uncharacterized protein n=1 Tax=Setaria viridis TaxID=4556 RepID=A0A4U6VPA1_SETVI|nr:hypothetical protein SEVIR_3G403900v2 [Setaria viridis]